VDDRQSLRGTADSFLGLVVQRQFQLGQSARSALHASGDYRHWRRLSAHLGRGPVFTAYLYGIGFMFVLAYTLAREPRRLPDGALFAVSAAAAVTHWSALILTIAALVVVGRVSSQAGLIVYPITNGLVIPVAVVWEALLLKQKIAPGP
jgi:hypothetical protein